MSVAIKVFAVTYFAICVTAQQPAQPVTPSLQENPYQHGVIFHDEQDVVFTESSWNLVIDYPLNYLDTTIQHLNKTIYAIPATINAKTPAGTAYRHNLILMLNTLQHNYQTIKDYTAHHDDPGYPRQKRDGWSNFLHTFGIPSHSEVAALNNKINKIATSENDVINEAQHQITLLKAAAANLVNQELELRSLTVLTDNLTAVVAILNSRSEDSSVAQLQLYDHLLNTANAARGFADQLTEVIATIRTGRLSTTLLDKHALKTALAGIARQFTRRS